jgi:hypothetical protein
MAGVIKPLFVVGKISSLYTQPGRNILRLADSPFSTEVSSKKGASIAKKEIV